MVDLVCDLGGTISNDVAEEDVGIAQKLAELSVGDHERAESTKTLQSLVAMLLSGLLVHWGAWNGSVSTIDVLRLPDEVLKEITLVLAKKEDLGLFNDIADICDETLSSAESLLEGLLKAGDARKLLRAMSICSLDGTLPSWKAEMIPYH